MPLQFSDKFFDEDPGLIKLNEEKQNGENGGGNTSSISQDFIQKHVTLLNDEYFKLYNKEN